MKEPIQLTYSFCFLRCLLDREHIIMPRHFLIGVQFVLFPLGGVVFDVTVNVVVVGLIADDVVVEA